MLKRNQLVIAFLFLSVIGLCRPESARQMVSSDPKSSSISGFILRQADVRDALKALFSQADVGYSVAGDVQGEVTINVKNQPFETVLQNILNQVGATYRIENGNYSIVMRNLTSCAPTGIMGNNGGKSEAPASNEKQLVRIQIYSADPALIAAFLSQAQPLQMLLTLAPESSTILDQRQMGSLSGGGGGGFRSTGGGLGNDLGRSNFAKINSPVTTRLD